MSDLFATIGRTFLKTFVSSIIVFAPGVLAAPNLSEATALAVAAIVASVSAGLKTIQVYVPQLSVSHWLMPPLGDWADSFVHGFLASLIVTLIGLLSSPELGVSRSIIVAALVGAVNAGARAVQGALTVGEHPGKSYGLPSPKD